MDENKLIPTDAAFPVSVTNIKENKANTFNIDNSQVTFNVTMPQSGIPGSAEQMIAIQSFSKKYYQLLVTCEEDVFQNNYVTVSANRALNQYIVPPEIFDCCSTLSDTGIAELRTFPAIICRENTELRGITDPNQWAMYAYITRVKQEGKVIKVAFHPLGAINQQKLCDKKNAIYFDLNMDCVITDLNQSAWSVHKVNLFEAFDEAGITGLPRPD